MANGTPDFLVDIDGIGFGFRDRGGKARAVPFWSDDGTQLIGPDNLPVSLGGSGGGFNQAQVEALADAQINAQKGQPNGILALDADGVAHASIVPRQAALATLTTLINGGGEIAVATDVDALVVLNDAGAKVFGLVPVDFYNASNNSAQLVTLKNRDGVSLSLASTASMSLMSASSLLMQVKASSVSGASLPPITLQGGHSTHATAGTGGSVYVQLGKGATATGEFAVLTANDFMPLNITEVAGEAVIGFFEAAPVAQPTVSGSRGGNAALASLLTALASLGLIVNSTTA
ncbi:hypothetical protein [Ferribacterium limneticum]|uniref:hypothetical protein n=1 Tax=Ferribacterium limneticum TaxID=76259 RepID=UPI001CF83850|nr:hypothetical protein [Ferribacterium limneticum]UCV26784.1 hypothetical protein KI617_10725 [Ferribacterium limneticum]UCV30701.1 hypothetical protein KI608_10725 [Ferribacterium limneticum]